LLDLQHAVADIAVDPAGRAQNHQAFDVEFFEHLAGNLGILRDDDPALDDAGFTDHQIADRDVAFDRAAHHQGVRHADLALDGHALADIEPAGVRHRVHG
jgi:hypothetical protein